jgi:hypothetical protein
MDINNAIVVMPELKAVEADLQVVETMCTYANEKKPLKDALQEVRIMSEWTPETIKASCKSVMQVVAEVFEREMNDFNTETGADVANVSLEPFKARFDDEIAEQANLKTLSSKVMEMASKLALALNISVPASSTMTSGTPTQHKKSFLTGVAHLFVEDTDDKKTTTVSDDSPNWLTEPQLDEGSSTVQKFILLNNKFDEAKSADGVRQFAAKFKMNDANLAEVILDVLEEARKQAAQCDAIVANVTNEYGRVEKLITVLLAVRSDTNQSMDYVSGK